MKKGNGKKIIITVMFIIVAVILIVVALYFTTDLLKSQKQLFFKYAMQLTEEDSENNLKQYLEKKEKEPYKNEGNIKCNVSIPEESIKEQVEKANNINIDFKGNVYNAQQKREQEITLNYDENINFPITFKQSGEYLGIQTEYIGSKYIAFENNNLQELCQKLGMTDIDNIPNKIDFEKINAIKFTDEEKEILKQKYKEVLEQQLTDEMFSKSQNAESIIYALELKPEDTKNIIKKLLEELKTDDILLKKMSEIVEQEMSSENFDKLIENIDELEIEENIKIQVYVSERKCNKISIEVGVARILLEKEQNNNSAQYDIILTMSKEEVIVTSLHLKMQYIGLQKLDNITEVYTIKMENTSDGEITSYAYDIENKVSFNADTTIEDINEDNAIILNNQSEKAVSNLMEAIGNRITEVNKRQMEELGVETNLLIYTNPITINGSHIVIDQEKQLLEKYENQISSMENTEKQSYNSMFTKYEGKRKGEDVKLLYEKVTTSNAEPDTRLIEIVVDIDNIKNTELYNISVNYDSDGYVNEIVVESAQ